MKSAFVLLAWCILTASAQQQSAIPPLLLYKTIALDKVEGRIDHMAVDVGRQRLFLAALENNTLEVLDLKAGERLQSLSGFAEPQGVAFAPDLDRVFVANGQDGTCRFLDGSSLKTLSSVRCGEDADNVRYDPANQRVYVGYGGGALAVLEARTGSKLADISLAGHPESFQLEPSGTRIFINVPHAQHIAVVDRANATVLATWRLTEAKSNFPLALDETRHRAFTGCRSPARLLVCDISPPGGRLITSVPIGHDTDDLFYDAENRRLYVSCGEGTVDVIQQIDGDSYKALTTIKTAPGARTSLFVPQLKLFCLAVPHRGQQPAEVRVFKTP